MCLCIYINMYVQSIINRINSDTQADMQARNIYKIKQNKATECEIGFSKENFIATALLRSTENQQLGHFEISLTPELNFIVNEYL